MPILDKNIPGLPNISIYRIDACELADEPKRSVPKINADIRRQVASDSFMAIERLSWYGGLSTWKEAHDLLTIGWPDGARRLSELTARIAESVPKAKSIKRRLAWRDDGDEIDLDRLRGGTLECWRSSQKQLVVVGSSQIIAIETSWGGNFDKSADELFWQGAAAAVLSDVLENAGYRVEINANCASTLNEGKISWPRVRVKEADKPMRFDQLAAVLCHAGIFRTFGLLAVEQSPYAVSLGHGREIHRSRAEYIAAGASDNCLLIGDVKSEDQAVQTLTKLVEGF